MKSLQQVSSQYIRGDTRHFMLLPRTITGGARFPVVATLLFKLFKSASSKPSKLQDSIIHCFCSLVRRARASTLDGFYLSNELLIFLHQTCLICFQSCNFGRKLSCL
mmetsp:Transcript_7545/g.17108  ORF Transcript_7545/g.17108 Transcript_7545/m.17108 type:complete len:107 (+) Transcript_7545:200-520(+)